MDISQATYISQRGFQFNSELVVVDCIDYNDNKTVFLKTGLRDTFLDMFPDEMFKEDGFQFFMDTTGGSVIMQIHDLHILKKYIEEMSDMKLLGIYWDQIYESIKSRHYR